MRGNVLANMPNGLETGLEHGGGLIGPTDVQKVETRQGRSWDRLAVKGVPAGCVCDRHLRRHRRTCFHLVFCFWSLRRIAGDLVRPPARKKPSSLVEKGKDIVKRGNVVKVQSGGGWLMLG